MSETLQPERVLVGNCPECDRVCVVFNNHEGWPLVACSCNWRGTTTELANRARRERSWARTRRVYVKPGRPNPISLPAGWTVGVEAIDQADGALIAVLPSDHTYDSHTETRYFQWVLPGTPNPDLIKRTVGTWGEARLCELEAF